MCFFLGKCWISWMFFELTDPFGNPWKTTTFNITAVKSLLLNICFSAVMSNMLNRFLVWFWIFFWGNVEYVECFLNLQGRFWPINSQNVQHLQHFPRKKHFLETRPRTYSTYSTLQQKKKTHFQKNVSYNCNVECFWRRGLSSKTVNRFNIFSLTAEKSTFLETGPRTYSTYWTLPQKTFFLGGGRGLTAVNIFNIFNITPPPPPTPPPKKKS